MKKRRKVYIALEELDFIWDEAEVVRLRKMWKEEVSLEVIAERMGRELDEVVVLMVDQVRVGKVECSNLVLFVKGLNE